MQNMGLEGSGRGCTACISLPRAAPQEDGGRGRALGTGQPPHTHTAVTARALPSSAVVCLGAGHLGHSRRKAEAWQCQGRRCESGRCCHWEMLGAARAHPTAFLTVGPWSDTSLLQELRSQKQKIVSERSGSRRNWTTYGSALRCLQCIGLEATSRASRGDRFLH